ncbi:ATP synthase subunit O, mitochondrial-like [Acanthaster planci]|uniref:ATP synthase peripheral stalk subunit OSCP, mitochondrial n=1 Tax=Acanthaster planci TaxID=133434 RepID=A0A8B7XLF5_ACAPL|nr:ATP synthase subunit O, mitochondrial-like [Acanthaster planci]
MATCRFSLLVRQFSTSSAGAQLVKPPIQVYGLGGRYAHALYSAAVKDKKLDVIDKELKSVEENLQKNVKLADFISNPVINRQNKISVLGDFMQSQKMSATTANFMTVLAENNRLGKMKDIFSAWSRIMSAHRGEVVCTITTAKPLDASQQKEVQSALQGFIKKGETLQMNLQVDPSVLGGMVVEIGDKYVDMSTATQVKTMTNLIKEAI